MRTFLKSFKFKVAVAFILAMFFSGALSDFLVYRFALKNQFEQLREKLKVIAQTAALLIDADTLSLIPLNHEGQDTPQFKQIQEQLNSIRKANSPIISVYILAKTEKKNILQFVVDADRPDQIKVKENENYLPGDEYNATAIPQMLKAFSGPSADERLLEDQWGISLSGYAPIKDKNGVVKAILGVDITAKEVSQTQKIVHSRALLVFLLGILFSLILGMLLSAHVTHPIGRLIAATKRIGQGDLNYKVTPTSEDEIGQLMRSFNDMAVSLRDSRQELSAYFYRVLQSFVRILEASDEYTQGHSKRVAELSEKIAIHMGYSPQKVELLREAALIHDIGKLGVEKSILNKKEQLTAEEWEQIKKHPKIGEDIVQSVVFSKEILDVVRNHHERFDGNGYPDQLKGQDISIFAAIVAVADAYDAMLSNRAYRQAFTKEQAVAELIGNRNTQFNGQVVDAFLQILEREEKTDSSSLTN